MASLVQMPAAQAETFVFQSSPLTNLDPAGAKINGGFTAFPANTGLYIQQCIAPVGNARPALCDDAIQLWVTDTPQTGAVSSKGNIELTLKGSISGRGTVVDCTTQSCGLFFRLDRTRTADTSEDKFIPISFRAGTAAPTLAADEVTVTFNGVPLVRNVPSNLPYRTAGKIVATSKSGLPVTLTSLTPECSYSNGKFTALKGAGQCALGHSTAGDATSQSASTGFRFQEGDEVSIFTRLQLVKTRKFQPDTESQVVSSGGLKFSVDGCDVVIGDGTEADDSYASEPKYWVVEWRMNLTA
jgi:hypothetical protein